MLNSIALMNGLTEKMDFLQSRQRLLSQNISNADTPGFAARDLKTPDFKQTLGRYMDRQSLSTGKLSLSSTSAGHVTHLQMMNRAETGERVRQPYEITMSQNGVNLEEQMMAASQTAVDYQLMTNVYTKNVDMLRAAMKA